MLVLVLGVIVILILAVFLNAFGNVASFGPDRQSLIQASPGVIQPKLLRISVELQV